ncbi:MAG: SLC13 family permease [Anaerolineales bacterium]|jgi:di/tricarboxylate transporter
MYNQLCENISLNHVWSMMPLPDTWIVLAILIAALVLFVTEWLRVDVVAFAVVVTLALTGVLTPEQAFAGFSNPAVLTIAALFIIGGAVMNSGLAGALGRRVLQIAGKSETRLIVVLMVAVALLSSIMSDTGTVAVLLPAVVAVARSAHIAPSKLLIPLSFGALLGGAATQIGTPPNIIVSDLLVESDLEPFTFFSFTPMGAALIVLGLLFMLSFGRRFLPTRGTSIESQRVESPQELVDLYRLPEDLFRLRVRRNSPLSGKSLAEANLRADFNVNVLEIRRASALEKSETSRLSALLRDDLERLTPEPELEFKVDDLLIVQGDTQDITQLAARWNLGLQPATALDEEALLNEEVGVAEVLLPPRSSLVGKTLVQTRFGTQFGLSVLGIQRPDKEALLDLKDTRLQFGDILLVQGPWRAILALRDRRRDFVVMGQPEGAYRGVRRRSAILVSMILAGMLITMITNLLPLATASWLAALALVLTGTINMDDAYQSIDWRSVVLIAGMLPMSTALEQVQVVDWAAMSLTDWLGPLGPHVVLAGIFILTSTFTQLLSNTATTVLLAPVALISAQTLGVEPHAFLMAVALAASTAFASPVASPVNTLVMGAGGYRFSDYLKVGGPMILLSLITSVLLLPVLFPF